MLRLDQLDSIKRQLSAAADVVERYQDATVDFATLVNTWIKDVEGELRAVDSAVLGSVASFRAGLEAVRDGFVPSDLTIAGRSSRTRRSRVYASLTLQRVTEVVTNSIAGDFTRFDEAARVALQLTAYADSLGLVGEGDGVTEVGRLLAELKRSEATAQAATHLHGLVGIHDADALLRRALEGVETTPIPMEI